MKRYSLIVIAHIILICLSSVGIYILFEKQLWFTTLAVTLITILLGVNLYGMQMRQTGMMRYFISSIQFNDMSLSFPLTVKNKLMNELAVDLTEALKRIRERILSDEIKHHYYENLLNKVDTAVMVTDRNGRIEWMNREANGIFGQRTFLPESLFTDKIYEGQVMRLQKDGIMKEMAVSSTSFSAHGKEQLLISLKNIQSVLERNEIEAWQKLIRVLTHEIMNSITPIISVSETLSERNPEKTTARDYKTMHQAVQTIHRRSKGLLEFVENYRRLTRIPMPEYSEVSVKDLFADLRKLFPDDYISFKFPATITNLKIDRTQIEQVMINLLKNAQEAVSKQNQPEIMVKAIKNNKNNYVKITVEDNGEGILPEVVDKIFVPFFTTKSTGSGIGLSLCKQIMNQHEGTISVQSQPTEGSCFILTFLK
jgi:Signal transduction histidine kinase involved in nitrogen fixation and metabolism regulation